MEYIRLEECAYYSTERTMIIQATTYISTENMLPDKGGVRLAEAAPECGSASKYEPGDILLSNIRPYFRKIWYADREGSCSNDVLVIKAKEIINSKFLYYVLSDNAFFDYDTLTSKGTKMPRGTKEAIMRYSIPAIPLPVQRRVAGILSGYDRLIENNTKRIKMLEQMAENLYKEWFVRFRFPGHENVPMENGLPKGWKEYSLRTLCEINSTTICSKNRKGHIHYLDTSSITNNNIIGFEDYLVEDAPSRARRVVKHNSIIFSTVRPTLRHFGIMKHPTYNTIVSTGFAVFDCYYNIANIIYLFLSSQEVTNHCQSIAECAVSTYPSIKPDDIARLKISLPKMDIAEELNARFEVFFQEQIYLSKQNEYLTRQRDLLLPRLMSGKLEVKPTQ